MEKMDTLDKMCLFLELGQYDMVMAPIEPTEAMVKAGMKASGLGKKEVNEIYSIMLLAAE